MPSLQPPYTAPSPPKRTRRAEPPVDLERLCTVIMRDRKDLEPFRRNRKEAVRQYGGKNYSDDCAPVEVPVNLIGMYVEIMTQSLVGNNPRVMYSTFDRKQEAAVEAMETWANAEIVKMNAAETYKRCLVDALFWVGILKIALATPADAVDTGWDLKAGQPFMEVIDPDDIVFDMAASCFDRVEYVGHRYRIPLAVAKKMFNPKRGYELEADEESDVNFGGDERIQTLGRTSGHREEIEDHLTLWEIYIPQHKKIITLRDDGGIPCCDEAVDVRPWIGPPCGPYHFLSLGIMPGNINPKAPIMDLIDLHRHYNSAYRKLLRQTRDYKKILPYRGGNTDEAKRLKDEADGGMFQCENPETLREIETGGPSNAVLVMSDHTKASFDFIAGNLALLGGRGAQSRTATQDKMLNENAAAGVSSKQDQVNTFFQTSQWALNWFWWYHPTKVMKTQWSPESMPSMKIPRHVAPWNANPKQFPMRRIGPMPDVKIDIYSVARQTPGSRIAYINQVMQTVAPMLSLAQQQGVMLDMNALLDLFAKYGDEPDLKSIFHYSEPPQPQGGSQTPGGGMPANTTRTYERYSHGGQGTQQKEADLNADISKMEGPVNPNS